MINEFEMLVMESIDAEQIDNDPFSMNTPGTVTFDVITNRDEYVEVEYVDYDGCCAWINEGIGIEYFIKEYVIPDEYHQGKLTFREGYRYTVHDVSVTYYPGESWRDSPVPYDPDEEYEWGNVTEEFNLSLWLHVKRMTVLELWYRLTRWVS